MLLEKWRSLYPKKSSRDEASRYDPMRYFSDFNSDNETAIFKRRTRNRMLFVAGVFAVLYGALASKLLMITVLKPQTSFRLAGVGTFNDRRDIVDRNGDILATHLKLSHLVVDSSKIIDVTEAFEAILSVFPTLNRTRLEAVLTNPKRRYTIIKQNITPQEQQVLYDFGIPGLFFDDADLRFYPQNNLFSHVVGLTDTDKHGIAGVEKYLDSDLKTIEDKPFALTVDSRVQAVLHNALTESVQTFSAVGAAGIIMNAKTGEVIALASLPDYSPNQTININNEAFFNRATTGAYEMGSTFKILNSAIGLDSGAVKLSDRFNVARNIFVGRFSIGDFHRINGTIDVAEIFRKSSNIGSVHIAEQFGPHLQKYYLKKFGLLDRTVIELPEKGKPIIPSIWGRIQMMTIAFGHGLAVTPLQMVAAVASSVNGGKFVTPTLLPRNNVPLRSKSLHYQENSDKIKALQEMWRRDDKRFYFKNAPKIGLESIIAQIGEQIIHPEVSRQIRYIMRLVCEPGGTGTKADVAGYPVIGKTGTAEKKQANSRGYNRKSLISSFVGAFPAFDPEYVIYVMVDEPKPNLKISPFATGGVVAAPIAGNVIRQIAPILNVKPYLENNDNILISQKIYQHQSQ